MHVHASHARVNASLSNIGPKCAKRGLIWTPRGPPNRPSWVDMDPKRPPKQVKAPRYAKRGLIWTPRGPQNRPRWVKTKPFVSEVAPMNPEIAFRCIDLAFHWSLLGSRRLRDALMCSLIVCPPLFLLSLLSFALLIL